MTLKTYGRIPKTLRDFCEAPSHAIAIDEVGNEDEDGYWIYLKPGFANNEAGHHLVREDTVKEVIAAFRRDVGPCELSDCTYGCRKGTN